MSLEYYTSAELIRELASRSTLAAIIVYSSKEVKGTDTHQNWMLDFTPTLQDEQVLDILAEITNQLGEKLNSS